ncbi:uncharacterized protein TNCV_3297291 [Trichonephila clavipes]|uniref:Uncharacterized protein n=1 Tax=Trichonephila clavipes TaxID=2585209 RepID=A0A8X6VTC3_TRICX|nr:uncharacterized protein TNCV_3297291 [Trichonephila clavipes]
MLISRTNFTREKANIRLPDLIPASQYSQILHMKVRREYMAELGDRYLPSSVREIDHYDSRGLMDDNLRPHRVHSVDEFLESGDIRRKDWPTRSLDLVSIEPAWESLATAITSRNLPSRISLVLKTWLLSD